MERRATAKTPALKELRLKELCQAVGRRSGNALRNGEEATKIESRVGWLIFGLPLCIGNRQSACCVDAARLRDLPGALCAQQLLHLFYTLVKQM
jgi:hypothetical protein